MLQSIMEMQKTQGQLVEAVQSLRESQRETNARVGSLADEVGTLSHEVGQISRQVHTAKAVVWVVGAGLASVVTIVGWIVTNAIAMLPAVLDAR